MVDRAQGPLGRGRWPAPSCRSAPTLRAATPWRAAEARLLARRIDELTRGGPFAFRRRGGAAPRHHAPAASTSGRSRSAGIPTYVLGGRGYWSQQQVADLRAYLAALANPRDELALYSVLASPLAGASLDALALLGLRLSRLIVVHLWRLRMTMGSASGAPRRDRQRAQAVRGRSSEQSAGRRRGCRSRPSSSRAVTASGYDRAVLALPAGEAFANVRKLMRLAREFEAEEGRDLRGVHRLRGRSAT